MIGGPRGARKGTSTPRLVSRLEAEVYCPGRLMKRGLMQGNKRTSGCCVVLVESEDTYQEVLVSHRNAFLAHRGVCSWPDASWPPTERLNVSVPTAARWSRRSWWYLFLMGRGSCEPERGPLTV